MGRGIAILIGAIVLSFAVTIHMRRLFRVCSFDSPVCLLDLTFYCSDFQLKELIDTRPEQGSHYIRSTTEPFDDEIEIDEQRVINWLVHFGLVTKKGQLTRSHVSGHGDGTQIKHIIEGTEAKTVIPIHTTKEKYHQRRHPNVRKVKVNGSVEL